MEYFLWGAVIVDLIWNAYNSAKLKAMDKRLENFRTVLDGTLNAAINLGKAGMDTAVAHARLEQDVRTIRADLDARTADKI